MATSSTKIWQKYVFSHLDSEGNIVYFTPTNGKLVYKEVRNGKVYTITVTNPTEAQMNKAKWYRTVNVEGEGTDEVIDNILYHYTGTPEIDEPYEDEGE